MPITTPRPRPVCATRGALHLHITFAIALGATASLAIAGCASRSPSLHATASPLPAASDAGRDLTADQQVLQVVNRLAFGPRPGEAAAIRKMGVDRWIARQLDPSSIDDRQTDAFVARFPDYGEPIADLQRGAPEPNKVAAGRRKAANGAPMTAADSVAIRDARRAANRVVQDVQIVRVARAEMSHRELQEVMTDFWLNHFSVYDRKGGPMRYYLPSFDRDVIRPHALGKFRDLLGAVAKSPAMLFYLDNWESAADSTEPTLAPRPGGGGRQQLAGATATAAGVRPRRRESGLNENYGRELLELHTLGVDGGYTQQDVINVARALTGWSIARPEEGSGFRFRPRFHDAGEKIVLGHVLPPGRGVEDGEDVLDILARHPSTARYIARKLCQRFAGDAPPPELVARAAETFTRTDGDIRQVVWTIVTSPEFYARAAYRSKVKSPFEVVVSSLRAVDAAPDTSPRTAQIIARMGEPIFGHQAPDGYPETGESWMNTGAILNRINFGLAVAAQRVPGATLGRWPGSAALVTASRAVQVDAVVTSILGGDASPDTRTILLSGEHPLLASGDAPSGMKSSAADPGALGSAAGLQGLAQVVGLALGAPEFQRR
jgi:uncharacterized protein (DUF1800 family)